MSSGADQDEPFEQSVGERLAAERTSQKLELSDISTRLRIPVRHLESIERGDHAQLPAIPYSAGFVKSYANLLGLDGIALSRAFRDEVGNERRAHFEPEAYEPVDPSRVPSRMLAMVALGVAILLGMGYLLLRFEGDSSELAKLAADTPEEINGSVVAGALPGTRFVQPPVILPPVAPSGPITVAALDRDVWVKITDRADGSTLYKGVIKLGDSYIVPDSAVDPILRTLLPQYVKVSIGETALPPVGEADTLVPTYSLKRDTLNVIATAPPAAANVPVQSSATAAAGDASVAVEPLDRPLRERRVRVNEDPSGSRPDTAQPISDDATRQRP